MAIKIYNNNKKFNKEINNEEKRINHKFNVFDECVVCNVIRETRHFVGDGFNPIITNRFETFYSSDFGKNWQKEYINCKK